jgi:hypothetical protein
MSTLSTLPPCTHREPSVSPRRGGYLARVRRAAAELTPEAIEQIARRVAELLRQEQVETAKVPRGPARLLNASELAQHLGLTRAWVYEHADELGAKRLGSGPRARLRFDLQRASASLGGADSGRLTRGRAPQSPTLPPRTRRPAESLVPLLPITPLRPRGIVGRFITARLWRV